MKYAAAYLLVRVARRAAPDLRSRWVSRAEHRPLRRPGRGVCVHRGSPRARNALAAEAPTPRSPVARALAGASLSRASPTPLDRASRPRQPSRV